ncbi:exodeoxyribonuclease I [Pseudoxanthomonas kalamensis DSM 18571]|uniref:exodeoxyribonuclease I n=1 Tax=Pseudoxanthomonas kalamensis TaxID=289483 RepID=UPI001391E67C|nr:exodeoxyribonuclease I [Pseudoxanthomonas kalamensis]KAF1710585.1 exodeoxyribonuclease I [Pseudoxanthomonas kalamensis DSM 18571]
MGESFFFYDLETFGTDPRRTRIAQFAAIRTDAALNPVDEPISFFVKPADDLLPSPDAVLITGVPPQQALHDGVAEAEAFARIAEEMSQPQTCTLGWNTLRFDDEFVRHGLFRNFHDPYEREWRGGNSRWDLLDVARLFHALRPDGIVWPQREDGKGTSFRLEHLAEANDLREGDAHEALSDVRATVSMARLMRASQPRLWDYALRLRDKRHVATLIDLGAQLPLLHISQRYPASRLCAAPVLPLARHPRIDNRVVVFDLAQDAQPLLELDADELADRLYTPNADLPEGVQRLALKEVHLNRCPALVEWSHLREDDFHRLGIDLAQIEANAALLRADSARIAEKVRRIYAEERDYGTPDADASLYAGFLGDADRQRLREVRITPPAQLGQRDFGFRDLRLPELLFRYRARNWPDTLSDTERQRWDEYRRHRLLEDSSLSELTIEQFQARLQQLRGQYADDGGKQVLLDQLAAWGHGLQAGL